MAVPPSSPANGATSQRKKNTKRINRPVTTNEEAPNKAKRAKSPGVLVIGGRIYNSENCRTCHQVLQDDSLANVKLQLIALIAKQPAFHQLRSVEQLGYITVLTNRSDSGIRGLQFIIQSTAKGPRHIDQRAEAFLSTFESELRQLTEEEFNKNVSALTDMKMEKHKNLREEYRFYWKEITDATFKFDRKESEVAVLKRLTQKEAIDLFDEFIKVCATKKKTLSICVYGSSHTSELEACKSSSDETKLIHIDDIFDFRRSQPLYGSFKGGRTQTKL